MGNVVSDSISDMNSPSGLLLNHYSIITANSYIVNIMKKLGPGQRERVQIENHQSHILLMYYITQLCTSDHDVKLLVRWAGTIKGFTSPGSKKAK